MGKHLDDDEINMNLNNCKMSGRSSWTCLSFEKKPVIGQLLPFLFLIG